MKQQRESLNIALFVESLTGFHSNLNRHQTYLTCAWLMPLHSHLLAWISLGPFISQVQRKDSQTKFLKKLTSVFYTCASTRAIHLELLRDLSVKSFLQSFRRFAGRRGLPSTLLSDNAKTFKAGCKEVKTIVRSHEVQRYLSSNRVTWKFIVERAPWWGGFWERLIQSVKKCLKKTVGRTSLDYDELNTVLVETESIINSRSLTYVYGDDESISHLLTPSH